MTESEFVAAIGKAREAYVKAVEKKAKPETISAASDLVKSLTAELAAFLATGARSCVVCETAAIGMRKNPMTYEVGCLGCQDRAGRGATPEAAVAAWNALQKLEKEV